MQGSDLGQANVTEFRLAKTKIAEVEQMIRVRGIGLGDEPGDGRVRREKLDDGLRIDVLTSKMRESLARSWASWSSVMSGSAMMASIQCHSPIEGEEVLGRRNQSGAVRPYTVRRGPGLTVLRRRPAFRCLFVERRMNGEKMADASAQERLTPRWRI